MTWFRRRPTKTPEPESVKAKRRAVDDLRRVRGHRLEVTRVAESLARSRERNHFADQIRLIFEGGE